MKFANPIRRSSAILFLASAVLLIAPDARAQSAAPIIVPVALAPTQRDTPVALVALTLDADISESGGRTIISGNSTFKLHNTDRLDDVQASVGFPTWAGDPYAFDPARFSSFNVSIEGKKVATLTPARAELRIGNALRAVGWYTFTVAFDADEKKTVRFDFQQDLSDGMMPRFVYGIFPADNWKGSIGSTRLTLRFPHSTTLEQIVAYDPPNPEFDGQSITWRFERKLPTSNPALTILRPSVWDDLNTKRRASQQNPNDANARAALGNLLRQLAVVDSPRRDGFAMQAIAELETAVRLDPNHRAARQALGAVYEARAGPAAGPRYTAYVQLAVAQWETVATSDANARRQLAEDYFYLGLEAQTRRDFSSAAAYYDKAGTLAPNGAGPLYTAERMNTQRRSLNIMWAHALIDQDDGPTAASKARAALGDKFMTEFAPAAFYVTQARVATSAQLRSMSFTLAPYLAPGELQNAASGIVASLRAIGADANLVNDGVNLVIHINVPFENHAHLTAQLDALTQAMPNRGEWALVRAVLAPGDLEWNEIDELFRHTIHYREQVDLAAACSTFNAQIDEIGRNLTPLQTISANDAEAQLKRVLLQYAQRGWQNALSFARVTYRAGNAESRVDACAAKTIAWSSSAWRVERVAAAVLLIEAVGIGVLVVRWMRRKRLAPFPSS